MTDDRVHELTTEEQWLAAFPVMRQLRTRLDETAYLSYLREMATDRYRLFAASTNDTIVSLAGVSILTDLSYGRYVWVHDLVTDTDHRSTGHGASLLSYIENWAETNDCERVVPSSEL